MSFAAAPGYTGRRAGGAGVTEVRFLGRCEVRRLAYWAGSTSKAGCLGAMARI
jgi:hypothetical protein